MNAEYSLIVSFLLHLKGAFVHTDSVSVRTKSVCAPTGSSVSLNVSCNYPIGYIFQSMSWTHRSNNGETAADPRKDSRYIYINYHHNCGLTINDLKETDAGTYYMSFTYSKGNSTHNSIIPSEFTVCVTALQVMVDSERVTEGQKVTLTCKTSCPPTASKHSFIWWKNERRLDLHPPRDALHVSAVSREDSGRYSCALERFQSFRSAETLLSVNPPDVVNERAGIVTLSALLTLIALLLICAVLWMIIRKKRQSLKRPEGKEKLTQDSTPAATFDLEEEGRSVHQEEVQYSHVHFCKSPNAQSCAKEADVEYSEIAVPSTGRQKNCRI